MRILVLWLLVMSNTAKSADPVIFVSAFRSGEDGAIHAYHFDSEKGQLTFLNRTTDVENPFFLAISPSGRFLYSIDAKEFGGPENEFVAAYQIQAVSIPPRSIRVVPMRCESI